MDILKYNMWVKNYMTPLSPGNKNVFIIKIKF